MNDETDLKFLRLRADIAFWACIICSNLWSATFAGLLGLFMSFIWSLSAVVAWFLIRHFQAQEGPTAERKLRDAIDD